MRVQQARRTRTRRALLAASGVARAARQYGRRKRIAQRDVLAWWTILWTFRGGVRPTLPLYCSTATAIRVVAMGYPLVASPVRRLCCAPSRCADHRWFDSDFLRAMRSTRLPSPKSLFDAAAAPSSDDGTQCWIQTHGDVRWRYQRRLGLFEMLLLLAPPDATLSPHSLNSYLLVSVYAVLISSLALSCSLAITSLLFFSFFSRSYAY